MSKDLMKPTTIKQRISLFDLFKNQKPIWVKNNSHNVSKKRKSGLIVLQVGTGTNRDKIIVPQGQDPICLSDIMPYSELQNCVDLRKNINTGALELLDPDQAEEYYRLHEDRKRVVSEKLHKYRTEAYETNVQPKPVKNGGIEKLNPKIQMNCNRCKQGNLSVDAFLEDLIENEMNHELVDLEFLRDNAPDEAIKQWAKNTLKSRG